MCLNYIIINLILWVAALYLITLGIFKIKILLRAKIINIFRIKFLQLFRIYYIYSWDYLLYRYKNEFEVYKIFDDYKIYIKNILTIHIPIFLIALCLWELFLSSFPGAVILFAKYCFVVFFIWLFIPMFFATYTWNLIKSNIKFDFSGVSIRLFIFILKFLIIIGINFCLEMILLILKAFSCALKRYFKIVFVTSLAILTFFDEMIRMYIDVIIYLNLTFEENFVNISLFLVLIIFVSVITSNIFQKIYFENLKSEHGIAFIKKESRLFSLFFTIIITILGFYLLTSYENNYLDLNGYDQNRSREVFKWNDNSKYNKENHDNVYNITISKAPLGYKKFNALLVFSLGLLVFSFVYYSVNIMFISNVRQKK